MNILYFILLLAVVCGVISLRVFWKQYKEADSQNRKKLIKIYSVILAVSIIVVVVGQYTHLANRIFSIPYETTEINNDVFREQTIIEQSGK